MFSLQNISPKTFTGFVVLAGNSIHLDRDSACSQKDFPFSFPQKTVEVTTSYNGSRGRKNKKMQDPFLTVLLIFCKNFRNSFHLSTSLIIPAVRWGCPSLLSIICHEIHACKLVFKHHPNPTKSMKNFPVTLVDESVLNALILNQLLLLVFICI